MTSSICSVQSSKHLRHISLFFSISGFKLLGLANKNFIRGNINLILSQPLLQFFQSSAIDFLDCINFLHLWHHFISFPLFFVSKMSVSSYILKHFWKSPFKLSWNCQLSIGVPQPLTGHLTLNPTLMIIWLTFELRQPWWIKCPHSNSILCFFPVLQIIHFSSCESVFLSWLRVLVSSLIGVPSGKLSSLKLLNWLVSTEASSFPENPSLRKSLEQSKLSLLVLFLLEEFSASFFSSNFESLFLLFAQNLLFFGLAQSA